MGAVLPASTTRVSGPQQTGPAPSCRRLTNTSQPERIIRSRLGSAQLRLRPCCWTRRNVSSLCTARQRVSWSVSRLSSGPAAPGTPGRHGNLPPPPPPPLPALSYLILYRHFTVESKLIILVRKNFYQAPKMYYLQVWWDNRFQPVWEQTETAEDRDFVWLPVVSAVPGRFSTTETTARNIAEMTYLYLCKEGEKVCRGKKTLN